ncbi:MAG: DNA-processing protein DprA [Planctomycetes bacterium]|nr:DNA-processing protein DprA [Planctomycetota bacterium]
MDELHAKLALVAARKFTPTALAGLYARFGSAAAIVGSTPDQLASVPGVNREAPNALSEVIRAGEHEREMAKAAEHGITFVQIEDPAYPEALKRIADPPLLLYVKGTLQRQDTLALAIVGSRNATVYGTSQASRFARDFGTRGITVVSGLARGIDTAAHRAALEGGGRTLAVVGSGLMDIYPPENARFVDEIAASGAAISEFPLYTPGVARNFPQRNRIIAGLALGVLVIEAGLKSGSLITARLAVEQGREVFALPGKVDHDLSQGAHKLIKEGAALVEGPEDVYAGLPLLNLPADAAPEKARPTSPQGLSPVEAQIWPRLKPSDPLGIDEIIDQTGLAPAQVTTGLLTLEMKRLAKALPGKRYVRLDV